MGARTDRAVGRLMVSLGALTDNKKMKDKGRLGQARGSARKKGGRAFDKLRGKG